MVEWQVGEAGVSQGGYANPKSHRKGPVMVCGTKIIFLGIRGVGSGGGGVVGGGGLLSVKEVYSN